MAATFIILFKTAEGSDSTFVTSTKRAELAKACDVLRDLTDDRLGDSFMDDFKRRLEEQ